VKKEKELELFLFSIVDKVKFERKKRKISQLKLANILDFQSPNYVAKIESKKHSVYYNISHLYKISKAFDIPLKEFF
jgi:transcriptional regulator with XRE-family HTH domain